MTAEHLQLSQAEAIDLMELAGNLRMSRVRFAPQSEAIESWEKHGLLLHA